MSNSRANLLNNAMATLDLAAENKELLKENIRLRKIEEKYNNLINDMVRGQCEQFDQVGAIIRASVGKES